MRVATAKSPIIVLTLSILQWSWVAFGPSAKIGLALGLDAVLSPFCETRVRASLEEFGWDYYSVVSSFQFEIVVGGILTFVFVWSSLWLLLQLFLGPSRSRGTSRTVVSVFAITVALLVASNTIRCIQDAWNGIIKGMQN